MLTNIEQIIEKLAPRLFFTTSDLTEISKIKQESARVIASRYTKKGLFIRIKRDFYVLNQIWQRYSEEEYLKIANLLQVPSYISFMTALSIYGVTTQVQRGFYESAAQRRSIGYDVNGVEFKYYRLKRELYFDFVRQNDLFISTKEKAFIDTIYLYSLGKYSIDFDSLDLRKLDIEKIKKLYIRFPEKTKVIIKKLCKI